MRGEGFGRGGAAGTGETGLQQVLIAGALIAQQADRGGLALHHGVAQQVGTRELATAQAHIHIEHVGAHVEDGGRRVGRHFGGGRGRRRGDDGHVAGSYGCGRGRNSRYSAGRRCGLRSGHVHLRHSASQRIGDPFVLRGLCRSGRSGGITRGVIGNPGLIVQQQGQAKACPQDGSQMFHGTGSIPPSLKGWQRRIRLVVSDSPFIGPCLSIASRA